MLLKGNSKLSNMNCQLINTTVCAVLMAPNKNVVRRRFSPTFQLFPTTFVLRRFFQHLVNHLPLPSLHILLHFKCSQMFKFRDSQMLKFPNVKICKPSDVQMLFCAVQCQLLQCNSTPSVQRFFVPFFY